MQLVFCPEWFYGIDILFETFSMVVALLISFYAYRTSKISKFRVHTYFAVFFFFIACSFGIKILMNFHLYYGILKTLKTGLLELSPDLVPKRGTFYITGYFIYRLLMTCSFAGLFFIVYRERDWKNAVLILYFVFMTTVFSHFFYFVFHLNMIFFLVLICRHYTIAYFKKERIISRTVASSFFVLLLSQIMFAFMEVNTIMYVIGETLQLFGFSLLLYNYIMVNRK